MPTTPTAAASSLSPRGTGWATHADRSGVPCCRQLFCGCSSSREAVELPERFLLGLGISPRAAAAPLAPSPRGPPPAPPLCLTVHAAHGMRQRFFPLPRELVNPFIGTTVIPIFPSKESWCLCSHCYCPEFS